MRRIAKKVRDVTGRVPRITWSAGDSIVAPCWVRSVVPSANPKYVSMIVPVSSTSGLSTTTIMAPIPNIPNTSAIASRLLTDRSE